MDFLYQFWVAGVFLEEHRDTHYQHPSPNQAVRDFYGMSSQRMKEMHRRFKTGKSLFLVLLQEGMRSTGQVLVKIRNDRFCFLNQFAFKWSPNYQPIGGELGRFRAGIRAACFRGYVPVHPAPTRRDSSYF